MHYLLKKRITVFDKIFFYILHQMRKPGLYRTRVTDIKYLGVSLSNIRECQNNRFYFSNQTNIFKNCRHLSSRIITTWKWYTFIGV